MSFKNVNFPENYEYSSDSDNLPLSFYLDVLPKSKIIYLKLGYFSSSALKLLAYGFARFIYNGGVIKIVTNHFLYSDDKELLETDKSEIERDSLLLTDLQSIANELSGENKHLFNCLKKLIAKNRLELIPVMLVPNKMTHYKQGIFIDGDDNSIFMDGSCNFTANGIIGNGESISVYRSWGSNFEVNKIGSKQEDIRKICHRESDKYKYLSKDEIMDSVKSLGEDKSVEELLNDEVMLIRDIKIPSIQSVIDEHLLLLEKTICEENMKPKFPFNSTPRDYQIDAYDNWVSENKSGIFAMATGTGKTITSLNCLLEEYKKDGKYQAVVLVPSKALLNQWVDEVALFNFTNVYSVSSEYKWKPELNSLCTNLMFDNEISFVVICTYQTFSLPSFGKYRKKLPSDTILIADEAHNIGSEKMKALLPELQFTRKIALSATPKRKFDEEGNKVIEEFFGSAEPYTFSYSMEKAINNGILCRYDYFPIIVNLTDEELDKYVDISKKIARYIDSETGSFRNKEQLERLLLKRKRIIHKAENKTLAFKSILKNQLKKKPTLDYSFVYTPEGYTDDGQNIMDTYLNLLNEIMPSTHAFSYVNTTNNKSEVMRNFERGFIHSLFSMKCLDEGVDIPRAELAIFCSSTGNPRQFIQRRGRVLRKHPDKEKATIYDMVVIPNFSGDNSTFNYEKKMIKEELTRVIYFSSLANNYYEAMNVFDEVASFYELDLYSMQYELGEH